MQIQISEPLMVMKFASKKSILEPETNFCWSLKNAMLFYDKNSPSGMLISKDFVLSSKSNLQGNDGKI